MSFYNPFASGELVYPSAYRGQVDLFSQTQAGGGVKPSPDDSPFPRVVDLWFLALCLGVRGRKRVKVDSPHKFITGDILNRDPWRIELLEFIAISESGSGDSVGQPNDTIALANEYAAGGMPELFDMLTSGPGKPLWNLTDSFVEEIGASSGGS
jgi:hypothetical protein